jgi:hypothetical protein
VQGLIHEDEDDSICTGTGSKPAGDRRVEGEGDDDEDDDEFNPEDDTCSTCSCSTLDSAMTVSTITSGDRVTLRRDVYSCSNMDHRVREFHEGNEIKELVTAQELVFSCSVLVGMHPDQAAEPLVDFALKNRKPFVLIPCCVYHKQFPHRFLHLHLVYSCLFSSFLNVVFDIYFVVPCAIHYMMLGDCPRVNT